MFLNLEFLKQNSISHSHPLVQGDQTLPHPLPRDPSRLLHLQCGGADLDTSLQQGVARESLRLLQSLKRFEMGVPDMLERLHCVLKWLPEEEICISRSIIDCLLK